MERNAVELIRRGAPGFQAVELRNGLFGAIEIVVWFPAVMPSVIAFPLD
jgi:hypothetical protein